MRYICDNYKESHSSPDISAAGKAVLKIIAKGPQLHAHRLKPTRGRLGQVAVFDFRAGKRDNHWRVLGKNRVNFVDRAKEITNSIPYSNFLEIGSNIFTSRTNG